jgi:hypothetical protein
MDALKDELKKDIREVKVDLRVDILRLEGTTVRLDDKIDKLHGANAVRMGQFLLIFFRSDWIQEPSDEC